MPQTRRSWATSQRRSSRPANEAMVTIRVSRTRGALPHRRSRPRLRGAPSSTTSSSKGADASRRDLTAASTRTHTGRHTQPQMARSLGCTGRCIATPTSSLIANTFVVAHGCLLIALYDRCLIAAGALSSVVRCAIKVQGDQECGCEVSTYSKTELAAQTTTNAHKHIRARADKGCRVSVLPVDAAILRQL